MTALAWVPGGGRTSKAPPETRQTAPLGSIVSSSGRSGARL